MAGYACVGRPPARAGPLTRGRSWRAQLAAQQEPEPCEPDLGDSWKRETRIRRDARRRRRALEQRSSKLKEQEERARAEKLAKRRAHKREYVSYLKAHFTEDERPRRRAEPQVQVYAQSQRERPQGWAAAAQRKPRATISDLQRRMQAAEEMLARRKAARAASVVSPVAEEEPSPVADEESSPVAEEVAVEEPGLRDSLQGLNLSPARASGGSGTGALPAWARRSRQAVRQSLEAEEVQSSDSSDSEAEGGGAVPWSLTTKHAPSALYDSLDLSASTSRPMAAAVVAAAAAPAAPAAAAASAAPAAEVDEDIRVEEDSLECFPVVASPARARVLASPARSSPARSSPARAGRQSPTRVATPPARVATPPAKADEPKPQTPRGTTPTSPVTTPRKRRTPARDQDQAQPQAPQPRPQHGYAALAAQERSRAQQSRVAELASVAPVVAAADTTSYAALAAQDAEERRRREREIREERRRQERRRRLENPEKPPEQMSAEELKAAAAKRAAKARADRAKSREEARKLRARSRERPRPAAAAAATATDWNREETPEMRRRRELLERRREFARRDRAAAAARKAQAPPPAAAAPAAATNKPRRRAAEDRPLPQWRVRDNDRLQVSVRPPATDTPMRAAPAHRAPRSVATEVATGLSMEEDALEASLARINAQLATGAPPPSTGVGSIMPAWPSARSSLVSGAQSRYGDSDSSPSPPPPRARRPPVTARSEPPAPAPAPTRAPLTARSERTLGSNKQAREVRTGGMWGDTGRVFVSDKAKELLF